MKEGKHHPHAHSHPRRRRGPRVYTEAELVSRARRLERRRGSVVKGVSAAAVVVDDLSPRLPVGQPAGQQKGRIAASPYALSRPVREALARREAEERAAAVRGVPGARSGPLVGGWR